jgi:RNA polymerase sigma-70 factor, ECF subfamily
MTPSMETTASDLFERHHVAIFRFFRRFTGDPDLAEDLTQEVFVRVVRGLAEYQPRGRETGWLFQIARNVLADYHRHRPERNVSLSEPEAVAVGSPAGQLIAFGLQEALDRLPEPERTAFLLREVTGLSYGEVAALCDTSEDGVGSRLFRARRRLRQLLSGRISLAALRTFTRV